MKLPPCTFASILGVLCLGALSTTANALEMRGFRGVSWGEGAAALGEAHAVLSHGDTVCYRRAKENMVFGQVALHTVRYCFQRDRLFMVIVDAAVEPKAVIAEFQSAYGPPQYRVGQAVSWGGPTSGTHAELSPRTAIATRLTIYSNHIAPALAKRMQKLSPPDLPETARQVAGTL